MIVMGIVGSGIFMNPSVVALQGSHAVSDSRRMDPRWFVRSRCGVVSGPSWRHGDPMSVVRYAYLREAFHPGVAFVYGWVLLS